MGFHGNMAYGKPITVDLVNEMAFDLRSMLNASLAKRQWNMCSWDHKTFIDCTIQYILHSILWQYAPPPNLSAGNHTFRPFNFGCWAHRFSCKYARDEASVGKLGRQQQLQGRQTAARQTFADTHAAIQCCKCKPCDELTCDNLWVIFLYSETETDSQRRREIESE